MKQDYNLLTGFGPGILERKAKHHSAVKIHRTLLQRWPLVQDLGELLESVTQLVSQKQAIQSVIHCASQIDAYLGQTNSHRLAKQSIKQQRGFLDSQPDCQLSKGWTSGSLKPSASYLKYFRDFRLLYQRCDTPTKKERN